MSGKWNIEIEQGATFNPPVVYWKDTLGAPIDLTGWTAQMQIRPSVTSEDVLIELNTENGRITLGGVDGTISLLISDDDTSLINWTQGVYDLFLRTGDYSKKLLNGNVKVIKAVTR